MDEVIITSDTSGYMNEWCDFWYNCPNCEKEIIVSDFNFCPNCGLPIK